MVYRGLAKHCKRSRWFELACLVERDEFELRCGLEAVLQTLGLDINSSL